MTDFPTIVSAVKKAARSERYLVLAALFALGAVKTPVTAGQVADLLKLHLGSKIPKNVNAALRRYSAYIRVEKGTPFRWALTPAGLEWLRAESSLPLTIEAPEEEYLSDVGIVCALEHPEFAAVLEAFGGENAWRSVGSARFPHVYRTCSLNTDSDKRLNVVGTTATSMGLTAASIVTTQLVMQFRPRIVLMLGIAAGTRDGNKQFGDVLVADPSVDYNSGKVVSAEGIRDFLPDPYPIGLNPRLRSLLQKYRGTHAIFDQIQKRWRGPVPAKPNRLHVGPLGAADQVIDDASRILEIQRNWRKLIGVEMETYGVYRACYEAPDPKPRFVSIKAVCDFAAEKGDSWQSYAAFVSAEFAFRFLKIEWDNLWPKVTGGS